MRHRLWCHGIQTDDKNILQQAVEALSTPGVHCFLHLLPSLCLCAAFTDIGPLNGRALQACSAQIVIFGLQVSRLAHKSLLADLHSTEDSMLVACSSALIIADSLLTEHKCDSRCLEMQTISLFGALKFCSLYLVLSWTSLAPPALAYNRKMTRLQATRYHASRFLSSSQQNSITSSLRHRLLQCTCSEDKQTCTTEIIM